jgi:hypothetical protein
MVERLRAPFLRKGRRMLSPMTGVRSQVGNSVAVSTQAAHVALVGGDDGFLQCTVMKHRAQDQPGACDSNDGDVDEIEGFHDFPHYSTCDSEPCPVSGLSPEQGRAPRSAAPEINYGRLLKNITRRSFVAENFLNNFRGNSLPRNKKHDRNIFIL